MLQALFVLTCITALCIIISALFAVPAVRKDLERIGGWLAGDSRFPAADVGLKLGMFIAVILIIAGVR